MPPTPTRCRLPLDGRWRLVHTDVDEVVDDPDVVGSLPAAAWRTTRVPGAWQDDPVLVAGFGTVWYDRTVEVPADWAGDRVILHVEAANHHLDVHVDGRHVWGGAVGQVPTEVDLTEVVRPGAAHDLLLRVHLPPPARPGTDGPSFESTLQGKQGWYGPAGGLWRPIELERRPRVHLADLRVHEAGHDGRLRIGVAVAGGEAGAAGEAGEGRGSVEIEVVDGRGDVVATERGIPAEGGVELSTTIDEPRPWSPDDPYLYELVVRLAHAEGGDELRRRIGFRTIAVDDGQLRLNGEALELRGVLDQDVWPGGRAAAPSRGAIRRRLDAARSLGFNLVRCHVKVPDPRYLDVADELGLLVWAELPHWEVRTPDTDAEARRTLRAMVRRDGHHPSIVAWTVVNESWGVDVVDSEDDRRFVAEVARELRELDPTRLVVDNSPCHPNFHLDTDVDDYHLYRDYPAGRGDWDERIAAFDAGAPWTFSPHGDAVRRGDEPRVLSEFGAWGLPALPTDGPDDPYGSGDEWAGGAARRAGALQRAERAGLLDVFGGADALVAATQDAQFQALHHQIGSLRRRAGIQGYVVTELTDASWEANGLLDEHDTPRRFAADLARLNRPSVLVAEVERHGAWAPGSVRVRVWSVHGGATALRGRLAWHAPDLGVPATAGPQVVVSPGVHELPPVELTLPALACAAAGRVAVEVVADDGTVLLDGWVPLVAHPSPGSGGGTGAAEADGPRVRGGPDPHGATGPAVRVGGDRHGADLGERLAALGCRPGDAPDAVTVTRHLDEVTLARVARGGRALLVAEDADAFGRNVQDALRPAIVPKAHDADWVPAFPWLARHGPFARFPGGPLLDPSFERVIGPHVIQGVRNAALARRMLAGSFTGWIHDVGATILWLPFGRGSIVATTFRLWEDDPMRDPVAAVLTRSLLELAGGGAG